MAFNSYLDWVRRRREREREAELERKRRELEAKEAGKVRRKQGQFIQPSAYFPKPQYVEPLRCLRCGFNSPASYIYCGKCGAPLKQRITVCPNCRESNSLTANFCSKCGYSLRGDETRIY